VAKGLNSNKLKKIPRKKELKMQNIPPEIRNKIISNLWSLTTALGCTMGIVGVSLRVLSGEWPPTAEIADEVMGLEEVIPR